MVYVICLFDFDNAPIPCSVSGPRNFLQETTIYSNPSNLIPRLFSSIFPVALTPPISSIYLRLLDLGFTNKRVTCMMTDAATMTRQLTLKSWQQPIFAFPLPCNCWETACSLWLCISVVKKLNSIRTARFISLRSPLPLPHYVRESRVKGQSDAVVEWHWLCL